MKRFNTTLRVVYLPLQPYAKLEDDGRVWGYSASRLGNISASLGITLEWVFPDDMLWGGFTNNQTWSGQYGSIFTGRADIVHGPSPRSAAMDAAFTSSATMAYDDLNIFAAVPSVYLPQDVKFSMFDMETGVALLCSLVFSALLGMGLRKLEKSFQGKSVTFWSAEILMGYAKTITQEGTRVIGGGWTNRIIFGFWMIASFFFMNRLTSYLKSGLLVQLPHPRLETVQDILARPKLKPYMGVVLKNTLEDIPIESYHRLLNQAIETDGFVDPMALMAPSTWKEVAAGEAVLLTTELLYLNVVPNYCPTMGAFFYKLPTVPQTMHLVWYFSKKIPEDIVEAFNIRIGWISEHPTRWMVDYQTYARNLDFCLLRGQARASVSAYEPLDLGQLLPFLVLYAISSSISIVAFFGEITVYGVRNRKLRCFSLEPETEGHNVRRGRSNAEVYIE